MKHKMKAHLSLALAAALALSLTACGPKEPAPGSSTSGSSASQSQENPGSSVSTPDKPDAPTNEGLEQLRKELEPSGAIAGIFSLGTHEGEPLDKEFYSEEDRAAYFREYPFLKEIPAERYARTEGLQVFCVVPADPKSSVVVKEWDESGMEPVDGKFGHLRQLIRDLLRTPGRRILEHGDQIEPLLQAQCPNFPISLSLRMPTTI